MCVFVERSRYAANTGSNEIYAAASHGYGYANTGWLSTGGFWYISTGRRQSDAMKLCAVGPVLNVLIDTFF